MVTKLTPPRVMLRVFPRATAIVLAMVVAALGSCSDGSGPSDEFSVRPDTATVFVSGTKQFTAVGAAGAVEWTSSNEQVASVVAQTGFATALGRGTAQITATSGTTASATLTVLAPRSLNVSDAVLEFEQNVGEADPAAQTVTITNAGDGTIDNLVVGPITYGAGEPSGWLTATSSGPGLPVTVTFQATGAGLHGEYTATVPFFADGVANSPQHVAVTFRVREQAGIAVTRTTVAMSGIPGATLDETVAVTNTGDLPLTGLSAETTYDAGQPQDWLTATLSSTTAPATLTLVANTVGLTSGSYSATVTVSSSVAGVAPVDITVPLTVSPGPAIQLGSNSVDVAATFATDAAPLSVTVDNSGGGTLSDLSVGTITYGAGEPTGWLDAVLDGTTAPSNLDLTFATASLASGTYSASVPVQSSVASNSPVALAVNLTVGPAPTISVNPGSVQFATWGGAPALPSAQAVQVTNTGGGTLSGLAASIDYTSGSAGWLTATFSGGTTAPATLLLQPGTTALTSGTRTAVVTISSSVPGVTPRTVTVTYVTETFTTDLFNAHFKLAGCSGCHTSRAPVINSTTTTASQYYSALVPSFVTAGNPSGSTLVCKIFGACTHVGGKFTSRAGFEAAVTAWINAGAPFQ